jgi:8-oxo-dGTP pyrophosphatase MutT (NUDIX family)
MRTKHKLFFIGVKGLIQNTSGQLLLLKRVEDNTWDLPGGRIDKDEQPEETMRREIKEETGLENLKSVIPWRMVLTPLSPNSLDGFPVGLIFWYFWISALEVSNITISDEHIEYCWMHWTDAQNKLLVRGICLPDRSPDALAT